MPDSRFSKGEYGIQKHTPYINALRERTARAVITAKEAAVEKVRKSCDASADNGRNESRVYAASSQELDMLQAIAEGLGLSIKERIDSEKKKEMTFYLVLVW